MKILVAEDERVSRRMLETILREWGYEPVLACDGTEAWNVLRSDDAPRIAILDWLMPGFDGLELCQKAHALGRPEPTYLIMCTIKDRRADLIAALRGGADDYISKPYDLEELHARILVAERFVALQKRLADRVRDLEAALDRVKLLHGLLPRCAHCKKIRNDQHYWQQLDDYLASHADVQFSHGVCPECYEKFFRSQLADLGMELPPYPGPQPAQQAERGGPPDGSAGEGRG
jgi:CheY-like chemotaxis protein